MTSAVQAIQTKPPSAVSSSKSLADIDLVRSYLRDIGRVSFAFA